MTSAPDLTGPPPTPPAGPPPRRLRRSRDGRVVAGVSAGLGEYFGLDPVLFRVFFAVAAFFGGAGIVAYLLAWAVLPEPDVEQAPVDRWIAAIRHHRVPVWAVVAGAILLVWALSVSWWTHVPVVPLVLAVGLVAWLVLRGRRDPAAPAADPTATPAGPADAPVSLRKPPAGSPGASPDRWGELRAWVDESRAATRARRRRAAPVRLATLAVLLVTLTGLGVIDAVHGVVLPAYFWATAGIVLVGLLVGLGLRRAPWSLAALLVPAAVGLIAFGGSHARLHDGVGTRTWTPTSASPVHYRLAFGRGELDLRDVAPERLPGRITVTVGAGEVRVLAPTGVRLTVAAQVRAGHLAVYGAGDASTEDGIGIERTVSPASDATGRAVRVVVQLGEGRVLIDRP